MIGMGAVDEGMDELMKGSTDVTVPFHRLVTSVWTPY